MSDFVGGNMCNWELALAVETGSRTSHGTVPPSLPPTSSLSAKLCVCLSSIEYVLQCLVRV